MAAEAPDDDIEKQQNGMPAAATENGAVAQSQELVDKVIEVVVVDCANKSVSQLERDSNSNSHEECRFISPSALV